MRVVRARVLDLGAAPSRNASTSMTSARPASAPPGQAAGDDLRERREVGRDADHAPAPRPATSGSPSRPRRTRRARRAARAAAAIDATRAGGSGTAPQAAPVGSRITQATSPRASSASSAPSANGSTTVRSGFGGEPTRRLAGSTGSATPGARVVVPAVEVPGQLEHAVAAGEAARDAQREQRRLGAAGGEAHALGARHERDDALGPVGLELAARAEVLPEPRLPPHRLDDGRDASGRRRARRGPSRSRAGGARRDPTCRRPRRA